jgi:flagellar motor switch protein FliG
MRSDVAQRMASLDQISPEIILKIAFVIGQKLRPWANSAANPTAACAPWRKC